MTVFTEPTRTHDLEITEFDYRYCRDEDTLAASVATAVYHPGTLLEGASGALILSPDDASTNPTTRILLSRVNHITATASKIRVLARGPAVLTNERLINVPDSDSPISAAQIADLAALSPPILIRIASTMKITGQPAI